MHDDECLTRISGARSFEKHSKSKIQITCFRGPDGEKVLENRDGPVEVDLRAADLRVQHQYRRETHRHILRSHLVTLRLGRYQSQVVHQEQQGALRRGNQVNRDVSECWVSCQGASCQGRYGTQQ